MSCTACHAASTSSRVSRLSRLRSTAFPHFFLLDPEMKIEYFPPPSGGTDADPYPAVGLVDKYL